MSILQIIIPLFSLAIGYYFQWQAKRLRNNQWQVKNSYKLGRMYKQIARYENIAKIIYITALFISCASFLF
jgi:hypothetical protein